MNPQVTVITAVYNGLPHLKEAIESTLSQTYKDFIYLIIDDASTDDSVKCIHSYKDSRIQFIQNEKNLGQSGTFNKALATIKTPYVVRVDQDDISLPNRIKDQIKYLEKHPEISVVSSWEIIINEKGEKIRNAKDKINNYGDFLGKILLGLSPIWHPSLAFRKKDLEFFGGFKEKYKIGEDFDVTTNFAINRFKAAIIQDFHLLVRLHSSSSSAQDYEGQAAVMRIIHNETINKFSSGKNFECLATLLRVEKDFCGKKYEKEHMLELVKNLDELISNVEFKQNLTIEELKSLRRVIYKRVGLGVRYVKILSKLPTFIYYPIFYALSPFLNPQIRIFLSKFYKKINELRYLLRFFKP